MNLISQFVNSLGKFQAYKYFVKQSLGKAFLYLFLVSILLGGIGGIKFLSDFNSGINEVVQDFQSGVPDFQLKNGELEVNADMPYMIEDDQNGVVIIDTTGTNDETILNDYENGIFISKHGVVNKENMFKTTKFDFSSLQGITITKEKVVNWLPYLKWLSVLIIVFGFIFYFIGKLISVLIVSVCGIAIQSILKHKIGFKNLYKLAIYAMTLPILVNTIIDLTGLSIPYFTLIYYGIALLYLWMAIKALKTDFTVPESFEGRSDI